MSLFQKKIQEATNIQKRGSFSDPSWSIADPAFASWLFGPQVAGVTITTDTSLGVPALWRAVNLISTTVASLPLKVYRNEGDSRLIVPNSWVDSPSPYLSPFSFKQLVVAHLAINGNAFLLHIYGGAGQIVGLHPIHPGCVTVEWDNSIQGKIFKVSVDGEQRTYSGLDVTHIHGLSIDGLRGLSPITTCKNAIGTAIAGNDAAARQFQNGGMVSGLVTSEEDLDPEEAKTIKADLDNRLTGVSNTGALAFVNRSLKFTPWMMNADEGQFIEQREFSVEEVSRIYGLPKELLSSNGASSWGSGIKELDRGMARYTFPGYTKPIEQAISQLLPKPRFAEFEYKQLLEAAPEVQIPLIIQQVQEGIITVDEARELLGRGPLPVEPVTPTTSQQEEESNVSS